MDKIKFASLVKRMDDALQSERSAYQDLRERYAKLEERLVDQYGKCQTLENFAEALAEQVRKATVGNFTTHEGFIILTNYQQFKLNNQKESS